MEHRRLAYLGMQQFPHKLAEFERNISFTFPTRERMLIDSRRWHRYRPTGGAGLMGF